VVDAPKHLPEIDLATLQEMAEAGAKVLNAQAVEWARRAKIAIHARKTSDQDGRETICREDAPRTARAVVGLGRVVFAHGHRSTLPRLADLPILDLTIDGDDLSCVIPLLNVPDWDRKRAELGDLSLEPDMAVVSVVGDGLTARVGELSRLEGVRAVCAGPLRIAAVIPSVQLEKAQRVLHQAFIV
jgi:aspartate kinase